MRRLRRAVVLCGAVDMCSSLMTREGGSECMWLNATMR